MEVVEDIKLSPWTCGTFKLEFNYPVHWSPMFLRRPATLQRATRLVRLASSSWTHLRR
ncbi:hypothetical protein RchiOBHm_Chr4g0407091 [Rosa chinensis]|uniref:Uncharacterized protein n=1 Tax=Rosa chinensis TaxID=74649 RepID=A0A2P6QUH6_ROSCH|nr:hypothetical protein RchiOBHm_Chr4g0407091 [Rosa chinensis]